jgi:serine phosphatase RsbU (regulator of sigma subunit)
MLLSAHRRIRGGIVLSEASQLNYASRAPDRRGGLSQASGQILSARTLDDMRDRIAEVVSGLYPRSSRLELFVVDGDDELVPVPRRGAGDARAARQLLASIRTRLLASHELLSEARVLAAGELSGRRSVMTAPISAGGELLGVTVVESEPHDGDFNHLELLALEAVATLAGVALQRLGQSRDDRRRARMELDRRAARKLQRGFMTCELPAGVGVTAIAEYLPAFDVGGDFYCVKHHADRTVDIAIGDVSGNGVSAALLMSRVAAELERDLSAGERPVEVLGGVNGRLSSLDSDMFVTAACARLDAERGRFTIANAGHLPVVVRRPDGQTFACGGASGLPLGIGPGGWDEEELCVEPGDVLVLMTDGLLEALDPPSGHRGLELLIDLIQAAPHDPHKISARVRSAVDEAAREHSLDDVTWVILQVQR